MKVWELRGGGQYRCGMAIVVASTAQRALELMATHPQQEVDSDPLTFRLERTKELPELQASHNEEKIVAFFKYVE